MKKKDKLNHFVDYYYKLKTQPQRKPHKVAIIACINKFLKVTFQLLTEQVIQEIATEKIYLRDYHTQPIIDMRHAEEGFQERNDDYNSIIDRNRVGGSD
ncbi:hypothetical protein [Ureibacillus sp. FSL W8-0352]|uniref:hypothetical protein n=1 Tax=Ureibacillus sp. FSL W8-0352 TaxID=2954596 RepID=UPI0030F9D94B